MNNAPVHTYKRDAHTQQEILVDSGVELNVPLTATEPATEACHESLCTSVPCYASRTINLCFQDQEFSCKFIIADVDEGCEDSVAKKTVFVNCWTIDLS